MRSCLNGRMKKKGNALIEGMFLLVVLFAFSLLIIFMTPVMRDLNTSVQDDTDISSIGKQRMESLNNRFVPIFNNSVVAILIALWVGGLITSFFVDVHPLFFAITVLVFVFIIFLAAILANTYDDVATGEYAAYRTSFDKINFIMEHLVEILILYGGSLMVAMYIKFRAI